MGWAVPKSSSRHWLGSLPQFLEEPPGTSVRPSARDRLGHEGYTASPLACSRPRDPGFPTSVAKDVRQ